MSAAGSSSTAPQEPLLAALYDWHNLHLLRSQTQDIQFWRDRLAGSGSVAVLGAGTGRVAAPLADGGMEVLAVDASLARLLRIPDRPGIHRLCADFTNLPTHRLPHDHVIFPYSAIQLIPARRVNECLRSVADRMQPGALLWVDVSTRFAHRPPDGWRTVLDAPFEEIDAHVVERQRTRQEPGVCIVDIEFEISRREQSTTVVVTTEQWAHADEASVRAAASDRTLMVQEVARGYGQEETKHRHIIQFRRL